MILFKMMHNCLPTKKQTEKRIITKGKTTQKNVNIVKKAEKHVTCICQM